MGVLKQEEATGHTESEIKDRHGSIMTEGSGLGIWVCFDEDKNAGRAGPQGDQ